MRTTAVIAVGLVLGLSAPAAAHAQFIDNVVRKAINAADAQGQRGRPERPDRDDDRGRAPDRDEFRGRPMPEDRGPPPMRLVSLNQVVSQIQRNVPGRLLDASGPSGGDRPVYRIRWQADSGQRIDFTVDARSGAILGRSGG